MSRQLIHVMCLLIAIGGFRTNATAFADENVLRQVDFANDIVPLLSRYGCNSGGCHGKASGQNGFKLSLFGFDTEADYQAIVQEARGRRVFVTVPNESLFLKKSTGEVPHGGGRRIDVGSESYLMLLKWIADGAQTSSPDAPRVVRLNVTPAEARMKPGDQAQLKVVAEYSDGMQRDVTRSTEYSSHLDVVAAVDPGGLVRATGNTGEAAIMIRYMGQVSIFQAIVPHGAPLTDIPNFQPVNFIDELSAKKWAKLGLLPSPVCDDATYLRRVTLDLCGRIPSIEETRAFLSDARPADEKRKELVERLLSSPDYAAFFAMRWGAILRNSHLAGASRAAYAYHNWLKDLIARNRPYDELARGVIAAAGEWQDAPAINWYWQMRDDQLHQVTADTAQVFLGIRLQCARCHHHPYERFSQEDYYGLAGFFTRLGRKSFGEPPPYFSSPNVTTGEKNPLTGQTPQPKFLDGEYVIYQPEEDPRHGLVDWMTQPDNSFFSRAFVNRYWGHFFGRGLVDEVDDMRATNPPSNPELLDALAQEFVDSRFDMRHIIRLIVNSRTYQLSSEPTAHNANDRQNFARFYARRMIAEVLLDSVDQACGVRTNFGGVSTNARAIDLPHEGFGSYFLDVFDRPKRVTGCECERSSGATLAQVLHLTNSEEVESKISTGNGRVDKLIAAQSSPEQIIEELYLATLSRMPLEPERQAMMTYLSTSDDARLAYEDILWTLLNSKEFLFNH